MEAMRVGTTIGDGKALRDWAIPRGASVAYLGVPRTGALSEVQVWPNNRFEALTAKPGEWIAVDHEGDWFVSKEDPSRLRSHPEAGSPPPPRPLYWSDGKPWPRPASLADALHQRYLELTSNGREAQAELLAAALVYAEASGLTRDTAELATLMFITSRPWLWEGPVVVERQEEATDATT